MPPRKPTKRRSSRSRKPTKRRSSRSRKPTKRRSSRTRKPTKRASKRATSRKPTKRAVRRRVGHIERPSTATRIGRSIPVYQVGVRGKPFYMRAGRRVDVTRYIRS